MSRGLGDVYKRQGDGFPLLAIVVVSLASATGIVLLTVKQKIALKETSDKEKADESADR